MTKIYGYGDFLKSLDRKGVVIVGVDERPLREGEIMVNGVGVPYTDEVSIIEIGGKGKVERAVLYSRKFDIDSPRRPQTYGVASMATRRLKNNGTGRFSPDDLIGSKRMKRMLSKYEYVKRISSKAVKRDMGFAMMHLAHEDSWNGMIYR